MGSAAVSRGGVGRGGAGRDGAAAARGGGGGEGVRGRRQDQRSGRMRATDTGLVGREGLDWAGPPHQPKHQRIARLLRLRSTMQRLARNPHRNAFVGVQQTCSTRGREQSAKVQTRASETCNRRPRSGLIRRTLAAWGRASVWSASWLFARMCRRTPGSAGFEGVAGCSLGWHGVAPRAVPSARGGRHAVPLASAAESLGQERAGQARLNSPSGEGRQGIAQEGEPAKRHRCRQASAQAGKQASRQADNVQAGTLALRQTGSQAGKQAADKAVAQARRLRG